MKSDAFGCEIDFSYQNAAGEWVSLLGDDTQPLATIDGTYHIEEVDPVQMAMLPAELLGPGTDAEHSRQLAGMNTQILKAQLGIP